MILAFASGAIEGALQQLVSRAEAGDRQAQAQLDAIRKKVLAELERIMLTPPRRSV